MDAARTFLAQAKQILESKPFRPHPLFTGGHAQTLAAYAWPRRFHHRAVADEERLFDVTSNSRVLAHCRWQKNRLEHPTIVLWHGIEGSSSSIYMLAMAHKAFRAGFNVVRFNLRNCGGTEHLTPTLYHGGLTEDLRAVVTELIDQDQLNRIFLVGFSLGGNMVLKLAGEYGENPPHQILGACAVSPSVDLDASARTIEMASNRLYQAEFMRRLKKRILIKSKLYPDLYDIRDLKLIRSIRAFDNRFTSVAFGFENADDYYHKASALRVVDKIRLPTLIIHAQDDPFIPFAPLLDPSVGQNQHILLLKPERGGHVAFISEKSSVSESTVPTRGPAANGSTEMSSNTSSLITHPSSLFEDRFWAENRAVEFCRIAAVARASCS